MFEDRVTDQSDRGSESVEISHSAASQYQPDNQNISSSTDALVNSRDETESKNSSDLTESSHGPVRISQTQQSLENKVENEATDETLHLDKSQWDFEDKQVGTEKIGSHVLKEK